MPKGPSVVGEPSIVQKGVAVILECTVEADPAPSTQWFLKETEIKEGDVYAMKQEAADGKIKIICEIKKFDKPLAGLYKVNISNSAGNTSSTFTVAAGDAPEMPEKPKIIQKDGGKILGIKVQAKSKTEPKVEWTKNEKPVEASERVKMVVKKDEKDATHYTFQLEITEPQKDDEAKYACKVINSDGSNVQSLNLAFD